MDAFFLESFNIIELAERLTAWNRARSNPGIIVFLPEAEKSNIEPLQQLCRDLSVSLVGAVFPALLANSQFYSNGILMLCFDHMPPYVLEADIGEGDPALQAIKVADRIADQTKDDDNTTLFLIFDALVPDIASILEQLYLSLADKVHYMGINAGSETFQPMPCLFDAEHVVQNGLLALLLEKHPGAVLEHGYLAPEHFVAATSTEGNRIDSINWRPAFEVYSERIRSQYGVEVTRDNFYQYAVHFPFGIVRADNEILVRIPVALEEDGSLFCVGEVPPNSILTLLEAPGQNSLKTTEYLVKHIPDLNLEKDVLTFYCAGRRLHLGEGAEMELKALQHSMPDKRFIGALSLGEIGSSREGGYPLFHNATLVCTKL